MVDQPSMCDEVVANSDKVTSGFGWTKAIIQECLIVVVINGVIAFFVFRGRTDIIWLGWGGIYAYLFPMSMMLPFFSSFFGYMIGDGYRRALGKPGGSRRWPRWWLWAILTGILNAVLGAVLIMLGLWSGDYIWPQHQFHYAQALLIVCAVAAGMAALFHSLCIRLGMSF